MALHVSGDISNPMKKYFPESGIHYVFLAAWVALFWVIFCWGFWDKGLYALGINQTLFGGLLLAFLIACLPRRFSFDQDIYWFAPLCLIFLGFSFFENPYLKLINIFVLPFLIAGAFCFAALEKRQEKKWDFEFVSHIAGRMFAPFTCLPRAHKDIEAQCTFEQGTTKTALRILIGCAVFLGVAFAIIVPLLSSADPVFAEYISVFWDWFLDVFSSRLAWQVLLSPSAS